MSRNAPLTTSATLPTTGTLLVNDDTVNDSTVVLAAPIALSGNLTIQVGGGSSGGAPTNGGIADVEGIVTGNFALTKFDIGTMILGNGANSFSGALNLLDGIVRVTQNGALGDIAGPTIVANGATLQFDGGVNYTDLEPVTLVSAAVSATNGAAATISGLTGANSFAGPIDTTLSSSTYFTGPGPSQGIDLTGNIVDAVDVLGPTTTIAGVVFNDLADSPNVAISAANTLPNWQTPDFGTSPDQTGLNTLMSSIRFGSTVSAVLSGLVPGDTYKIQLLTYDPNIPNRGDNRRFDIYQDGTLLAHNYASAGAGDVGTVFTYAFTATSSQSTVLLTNATVSTGLGYDGTPVLQGLTVADTTGTTLAAGPVGIVNVAASSAGSLVLGGSLNLHNSGVVVSAAGPVTLTGNVLGSGSGSTLTKTGTASLTLGGANTYAGITNIAAGNVIVASTTTLGAASAGTTVAAGSSLLFVGGINYTAPEAVTVDGTGTGATIASLGGASTFAGSIQVATPSLTRSTFTGGDVGEGLDLTGDIVDADMVNDDAGASPTVVQNATFITADQDPNAQINGLATIPNWAVPTYGANPTDANNLGLDTVMHSIQHGQYQPGFMTIDLRNLVPGTAYKLQLLFQEGGGSARRFNIYFDGQLLENQFASSSNSNNVGSSSPTTSSPPPPMPSSASTARTWSPTIAIRSSTP